MANVSVYNMGGQEVGTMEVSDAVFAADIKENLVHLAVVQHLNAKRQGTQKAKTRGEVSGGGRKPWRQKGTGHARQGSTRAPQWTHGGVVFAPVPRSYKIKMNKKEKQAAIKSVLTSKLQSGDMIVLDALTLESPKTKVMAETLKNLNAEKAYVVIKGNDKNTVLAARNLADAKLSAANTLNVYEILKYKKLVLTKDAVKAIEEVYA
ncbi:MAG: 50S ribosomal protein L4 [Lachnospiraceae bacterium]|jgi:large subunit ribosomal protein L4|nr:50S ribosomal protein L4 [Lachnospiraceae bacterium]